VCSTLLTCLKAVAHAVTQNIRAIYQIDDKITAENEKNNYKRTGEEMKALYSIILILLLSGCTTNIDRNGQSNKYPEAKSTYPYIVKVVNFNGAVGVGTNYYITYNSVIVVAWNDFNNSRKEIIKRILTSSEKQDWSNFIQNFPFDELETEYIDPAIGDGLQRWFYFNIDEKTKEVVVKNINVKDLTLLCKKIKEITPHDFQPEDEYFWSIIR
jgi:hypothetical protein